MTERRANDWGSVSLEDDLPDSGLGVEDDGISPRARARGIRRNDPQIGFIRRECHPDSSLLRGDETRGYPLPTRHVPDLHPTSPIGRGKFLALRAEYKRGDTAIEWRVILDGGRYLASINITNCNDVFISGCCD
jgi:hypothetical protein